MVVASIQQPRTLHTQLHWHANLISKTEKAWQLVNLAAIVSGKAMSGCTIGALTSGSMHNCIHH